MSNSDQRMELIEDPGSTTPLDYEKLYLEKQYQIKETIYNILMHAGPEPKVGRSFYII